ncbi:MAG: restriction endonuclease [Acidobacteria bacterium]|nr:restriction endonuclease [Acidobacteriota bacterium]MYK88363.1 restriction endonuclease [Acidobacteriota bacterium]
MNAPNGGLFATDFLEESITGLDDWKNLTVASLDGIEHSLRDILNRFPTAQTPNESQTEDDLIWPVLACLGWTSSLRQQNLSPHGVDDVPDGLLFADEAAKTRANGFAQEWRRYELGLTIVESKRWGLSLDGRAERQAKTAPSTQMLRYLRRVDDLTTGRLRWGILTNGARWRLYYQGAQSVSEEFCEIDLATVLDLPGHNEGLFALDAAERRHWLTVFVLLFRRDAFLPTAADPRTFHRRALEEGRYYEQRVAADLSNLVFDRVFPELARAIAEAAPNAPLPDVRDATLTLLYRLLFILYAEDRELLPVRDERYDDYGLRMRVRDDVRTRKDRNDVFSTTATRYWTAIDDLATAIDRGDASIGLPPYNGGLFDRERTPLLANVRLGDEVLADVIDTLSFEQTPNGRRYINYRDLSVQQLGSIYERLLERELVRDGDTIVVRPNVFARKGSGSYFTPHDLVNLILQETIGPLVQARLDDFARASEELAARRLSEEDRSATLERLDPAERVLDLRICDPAMGSGHFLVGLVDYLADRVISLMAEAEALVDGYASPLTRRIDDVRRTIIDNARERNWTVDPDRLDDRHLVRRIVLKRCVYGVDRNPMAVELAKVSLWLHTFTAGAPLSFLDHHLRCGNSLFGCWARNAFDTANRLGSPLFLHEPLNRATRAAMSMQTIEELTDAEITQADQSAGLFDEILEMTAPLDAFLSLVHAFEWLNVRDADGRAALRQYFQGAFGDPVRIATGEVEATRDSPVHERFAQLLDEARRLADDERFFNWQPAFPSVWTDWDAAEWRGGFDAVIGNPPWDRMKLQQVEWFAYRRPEIAHCPRAADRKQMVATLQAAGDPLADEYELARDRAESAVRVAQRCGNYPLLSQGDVNIYSLFVERAFAFVKPEGVVGLLTPSGIASDKTSAGFFRSVASEGRLRTLYDFENRRTRFEAAPFFPDVDSRFKFCVFVAGRSPSENDTNCAFFLQDVSELNDDDRRFALAANDFGRVNPNTGTAPVFRSRRDADLTTAIYRRLPVLVDRSHGQEAKSWPVKYNTMFHMTNDSGLFRTRAELEDQEGAWPSGGNRFDSPAGEWLPLYEGKMVQAFDHRAARIVVNPANLHRPAQPEPATEEQHRDANWLPEPQYWVSAAECGWPGRTWVLGFKEITAPTNARTFIAAVLPAVGFGNKIPILKPETPNRNEWLLAANFNSTIFNFVTRQKVQGQTLNLYIVEQLPVVPLDTYNGTRFGTKTAAEIVREAVLELTYTAHDMAPFAADLGHVDAAGTVEQPFRWDPERRLHLCSKLDALFFHLYGVTDRDDVGYVWSTFPIVERQDFAAYGRYRSRDLCLAYMNALAAGRPDAIPDA